MRAPRRALVFTALSIALTAGCATDPQNRRVGEVVDDASVTARVKTALIREDDVKARNINVQTYRGIVELSGFVDTQAMADRAVLEAQRVPGVAEVRNALIVEPRR